MVILYVLYATCFLAPALLVALYYFLLMVARLLGVRAQVPAGDNAGHTFGILIPAHNEEKVIANVLRCCDAIDYPRDMYGVFVIADNCVDRTADIVRARAVTCLERKDDQHVGKGYALEWALRQLRPLQYDAVVVLDADCAVDAHALRVFDRCLEEGADVLQATHVISNPDESAYSYAARVGQFLEYEMGYAPKSRLGLSVPLVGTGMVIRSKVLEEVPWTAHSLVEDTEYTLLLAERGTRVRFVDNVRTLHASETRADRVRVQRTRWARGLMRISLCRAIGLVCKGLATRRLLLVDAGWTLLTASRPLVLVHLLAALAIGAAIVLLRPATPSIVLFAIALFALAIQASYYATGIALVGLKIRRLRFLLSSPLVVLRLAAISLASLRRISGGKWVRTPRE